jgi:hypothetical protein
MANPYDDNIKISAVTDAGATIDYGQWMGAIIVENLGDKDCWIKFDGAPGAADANGQWRIKSGKSVSASRQKFKTIGVITAAAETTSVQAWATEAFEN